MPAKSITLRALSGRRDVFASIALLVLVACSFTLFAEEPSATEKPNVTVKPTGEDASEKEAPAAPQSLTASGVERLYRLSERLYSGGQPQGEEGFRELAELGVKTLISVDGARTDVATARRFGMRYIHLPIGYEGIGREQLLQFAKAATTAEGPIFVHCHHGKHRGPAAAAVCAMTLDGWTPGQSTAWMKEAGTSPAYAGLYRSVQEFEPPTAEELAQVSAELPAQVPPKSLVAAMVDISLTWDRLQALQAADFATPQDNPDLTAAHEALQLEEHYRELMRTEAYQQQDDDFQTLMTTAHEHAVQLKQTLQRFKQQPQHDALATQANDVMQQVKQDCKRCHAAFRDGRAVD